jgi:transcriptional regulator with XRE-family HTH domain
MRKKTRDTPLRNLRRARTISQANFARLLGVSQQTYSKYESGLITPPRDQQARIATILGVVIADVFGEAQAERPELPRQAVAR